MMDRHKAFLRSFWLCWGRYWLPVVFWMGVIFFISAQTKSDMPHCPNDILDWPLKKLAHLMEYGVLTLLLWWAISGSLGDRARWWHVWVIPTVCVAYAALDEYHQSFVAGRGSSMSDVLIDTLGILLTLGGMSIILSWRAKYPSWFRVRPWLDRFLGGFLPFRPVAQNNTPE